jgi:hypothetical protein
MADRGGARPGLRLTGLVAGLVLLAGCSSLPMEGPVHEGRDLQLEREDPVIRSFGQPPVRGAQPADIVRGFLQAAADFRDDHAVAREYLAPRVRERWRPGSGATVYDRSTPVAVEAGPGGVVTLNAGQVAVIDGEGRYLGAPPEARLERTFRMVRVDGEWRIAALADGLVLTRGDVQQIYRQVNLYFVAPSRRLLVPDPVFLPALPGLSTKLVSRLLRGPTASLRGAVTTGFPRGTALAVSSVPVRDGLATVSLDADALQADDTARELMSAQLVWTLAQLPEMRRVRITADGEDLGVSGAPPLQPRGSWSSYDPAGLADDADAYLVRGGRVGRLLGRAFVPVPGPAGDGSVPLRRPAVSLDGTRLAALTPDGRGLVVGRLAGRAPAPVLRVRGTDLAAPSWDGEANAWVADRATGRVWMVPSAADRKAVPVGLPKLPGRPTAVRLARDGVRAALVVGSGAAARLVVCAVVRDPEGTSVRLVAPRPVLPALTGVVDVAWADPTSLTALGRLAAGPSAPVVTDLAGYEVAVIDPLPDLVSVAAAPPARPVLAGSADGRVQRYTAGRGWEPLGAGSDPTYPG